MKKTSAINGTNAVPKRGAGEKHTIHLLISKDEENIYSVEALNLPGAGSCGDTIEEAIGNAEEAVLGVIESYVANGLPIPWKETSNLNVPIDSQQRWIDVHV